MSDIKLKQDLEKLSDALQSLQRAICMPALEDNAQIDTTIQRFEFTIELMWKFLRHFLESRGEIMEYRKDVLRAAYKGNLIEDEDAWLEMVKDRNLTSHTYNRGLAQAIYERVKQYAPVLQSTFEQLKNRIENS